MRILFAGNVANTGYVAAKLMRNNGIEAFLLMEKNPPEIYDPLKTDPTLECKYPNWVLFFDKSKPWWKFKIIQTMRKFDLIQAHYDLCIFAYLSRRPFIAQEMGDDLRVLAFQNSLRGRLLRRSYKKSKIFLYSGFTAINLLSKLKIKNSLFFPLTYDDSFFIPQTFDDNPFKDKFVIFHPTNLWWKKTIDVPITKGNDILIYGFANFIKKNSNSLLIIVNRGPDVEATHDLINSLGIENNVIYLNGPLNSADLRKYYNLSDVVADQFVLGDIGLIIREALSCAKPVIAFYDKENLQNLYGDEIPILNVKTPKDVEIQLELLMDAKKREKIGNLSNEWIKKHYSSQVLSKKMIIIYNEIYHGSDLEIIKKKLSELIKNNH
jgi:glycosyltransferase involved in cell wall biosynthesis